MKRSEEEEGKICEGTAEAVGGERKERGREKINKNTERKEQENRVQVELGENVGRKVGR